MRAILLIDHGSRRHAANDMLHEVAALVESVAAGAVIVVPAHMELAEPSIATGFATCVARGATEVIAVPYMLSPGRHSTEDIPRLVAQAAAEHAVSYRVATALGVHRALAEVVLERASVGIPSTAKRPARSSTRGVASVQRVLRLSRGGALTEQIS